MTKSQFYSINETVNELQESLQSYLEAQYHIRNLPLIKERRNLLETPGIIIQRPYIEATQVYQTGKPYSDLRIPEQVKSLLTTLAKMIPPVGIYPSPYIHQSNALQEFLGNGNDIIIATGTGSGKTESFLMPLLGKLILEGHERPDSAKKLGCRAILLYPMNALVNDQLGRIRRLIGDERVSKIFAEARDRIVTFGSYTGRTAYPGQRDIKKDKQYFQSMFEGFFLKHIHDKDKVKELREMGRWPCKDLEKYYGLEQVEHTTTKTGKPRTVHHWDKRLITQKGDRELLSRHEMLTTCPDILITNYSMLEYMLMRPIERQIFESTKQWLTDNEENEIVLVLDEAHMYRGAGGAEVSLLIRRLQSRLGITRDRMRCILTSASLGDRVEDEKAVVKFANDLTGTTTKSKRKITLIKSEPEKRSEPKPSSPNEVDSLASFDIEAFQNILFKPKPAFKAIQTLAKHLSWDEITDPNELQNYLFHQMEGFGPLETLIKSISGKAIEFKELQQSLFPTAKETDQQLATESLLALSTYAKRASDGRVLLPSRVHMFFRGLPGLYACINKNCDKKLFPTAMGNEILGKLYPLPRVHCDCNPRARVYELLTHRDCGCAFIRGYKNGDQGDFLWHEGGAFDEDDRNLLTEIELFVEGPPHNDALPEVYKIWVDLSTGKIKTIAPTEEDRFLTAWIPSNSATTVDGQRKQGFERCPKCLKRWRRDRSKIMDLVTKGEAPFANLVKSQLFLQPAKREETDQFPNAGRKVLLFSDGRQKAARLARDIPREVELDSFKQAIALATKHLTDLKGEARIGDRLYISFVSVASENNLHFFDASDQLRLLNHVKKFRQEFESELREALEEAELNPPPRYKQALLRQLCHPHYSFTASTLGWVVAAKNTLKKVVKAVQAKISALTPEQIENILLVWIWDRLGEYAFDNNIPPRARTVAAGYPVDGGSVGNFDKTLKEICKDRIGLTDEDVYILQQEFLDRLCSPHESKYYLDPSKLALTIDLEASWHQCQVCTSLKPIVLEGSCCNCGSSDVKELPANDDYIQSRKSFWRKPVAACLGGEDKPSHVTAEEHSAQLSHRDTGEVFATTENYELRFQDLMIGDNEWPIDVLSCTTTMEVGVDIGSLTAIGMRNIPPQRENYQQRAGRSGRRGSSVSTVVTFGQSSPHDNYFFHCPQEIVAGAPRQPMIKIDNARIATRHVNSFLFQTFFHSVLDKKPPSSREVTASLQKSLGLTLSFFKDEDENPFTWSKFKTWLEENMADASSSMLTLAASWIPEEISKSSKTWIKEQGKSLIAEIEEYALDIKAKEEKSEHLAVGGNDNLLDFLFHKGILPSYAFPTDLCSFIIEGNFNRDTYHIEIIQSPQQSISKALSEYAPGRFIVVDKKTYRSGGVAISSFEREKERAVGLFDSKNVISYRYCSQCLFVQDPIDSTQLTTCPVCAGQIVGMPMIKPAIFYPEKGREIDELDNDQEFSYATSAQFPLPVGEQVEEEWIDCGEQGKFCHAENRLLIIANKGRKGIDAGFEVCELCGAAAPRGSNLFAGSAHDRPYKYIEKNRPKNDKCSGGYRDVFLGTTFNSDLLLLRFILNDPLAIKIRNNLSRRILYDGLHTVSDALVIGASRYLGIDSSEFSGGYRIVPTQTPNELNAEVYLYDTLSGGAGYSYQAGQNLGEVLNHTITLLENCPAHCETSCHDCLRHYYNQRWHHNLDRHLAAALIRYMTEGTLPEESSIDAQEKHLVALKRMLELDGYTCQRSTVNGINIPLVVETAESKIAIGTYPAWLNNNSASFDHSLFTLDSNQDFTLHLVNEYMLLRNLPLAYQDAMAVIDPQGS